MKKPKAYADPDFAAEMEELAATRRAEEAARLHRPPTVNTVDKSPLLPSELHRHTSACLKPAEAAPKAGAYEKVISVPVDETWHRCMRSGTTYHQHQGMLVAHLVGDVRCTFPGNEGATA